jgi:hypothetical protein
MAEERKGTSVCAVFPGNALFVAHYDSLAGEFAEVVHSRLLEAQR